ncbi:MAG: Methyltransferase type 12 [Cryobacterium sp.]|jgi:hypothetical protein|nr:Methyltransferase type 12 [Cryobacterium sp.]
MPITPDTKDWTWVLQRPCPECGFKAAAVDFDEIPRLVLENAAGWGPVLQRADANVRPDDVTWSPLEYAAHVRDVFRIFAVRLAMMQREDTPRFPNWDQDATAREERYNEQDPDTVFRELEEAASAAAELFRHVPRSERDRQGRRSDGAIFTITSLGKYFLHDPIHHLHDVGGD